MLIGRKIAPSSLRLPHRSFRHLRPWGLRSSSIVFDCAAHPKYGAVDYTAGVGQVPHMAEMNGTVRSTYFSVNLHCAWQSAFPPTVMLTAQRPDAKTNRPKLLIDVIADRCDDQAHAIIRVQHIVCQPALFDVIAQNQQKMSRER